jgi:D-beta-D-heptose 7-phosphate kinase/D-beta-D-heptose 1-phosphate adenosyltransferase
MKIVIVSGYFNPVHKGHIEYFNNAKSHGDQLYVIVNSDLQRELKGSKEFQDEDERMFIIQNLKMVDRVFLSVDTDRTVCKTIEMIHSLGDREDEFLFANGGDQTNNSIPEKPICDWLGINLIDGLGDKIQSSSWLLKK